MKPLSGIQLALLLIDTVRATVYASYAYLCRRTDIFHRNCDSFISVTVVVLFSITCLFDRFPAGRHNNKIKRSLLTKNKKLLKIAFLEGCCCVVRCLVSEYL